MSEMTTQILQESLGKTVLVRLKSGKSLRGKLRGFDQHLNLVLDDTEDNTDPDNGSERKVQVSDLTPEWQTFTFPLSSFDTADLTEAWS